MTGNSVATLLIGFLGGSVVAALMKGIYVWWTRPILTSHFVEGRGCYVTTGRGSPSTHDAKFLRLLIENQGRSTIHNCKGYIIHIDHKVNGVSTPVQQEVLELQWSFSGSTSDLRSIPPRAFFYMDVVSLDLVPGAHILWPGLREPPNHYAHMFGANVPAASYALTVRIVADDADPIDHVVRFDFDPQRQDLSFEYDRT